MSKELEDISELKKLLSAYEKAEKDLRDALDRFSGRQLYNGFPNGLSLSEKVDFAIRELSVDYTKKAMEKSK